MEKQNRVSIGISKDRSGWCEHFIEAVKEKIAGGFPCTYSLINLDASDWIEQVKPFDVIVWKPRSMGVRSASYFKEKIYFLQHILHKLVLPNFETIWHFESKIAQSYLFAHYGIKTPNTFASFDFVEARQRLETASFPLVFKKSNGAGSRNVALITDKKQAIARLEEIFGLHLWVNARDNLSSGVQVFLHNIWKKWAWITMFRRRFGFGEDFCAVYWQDFVKNNRADLRITVIGDCYAFGFWRNNRPNDFRASGSGLIDYQRAIPEEPLRYCMEINRELGFDSMCYDILFDGDDFVISELSYGYLPSAVYKIAGHYFRDEDGGLSYNEGQTWPQKMWIEWALQRVQSAMHKQGLSQ